MARYLKLNRFDAKDVVHRLHIDEDIDQLAEKLRSAGEQDVVEVQAQMDDQLRMTPLYIRPWRWDSWMLFEHDPEQPL
ncbi:hypothetical protein M3B38_01925 [Dietzia cinnamea]|uniref:hypothetical protein n=1 Tax=Dietzia cinnamea TaxID=321318 RepID=UPI0021A38D8E|nr:hypothetical protein [Dietzia cinnamea]MCT1710746.1 hypothetical protein [Dietzia cinnamea]